MSMEIYNGDATAVEITLPSGATGPLTVNITQDGEIVKGPISPTPVISGGKIVVPIPYSLTTLDSDLVVECSFSINSVANNVKRVPLHVVTPLLTLDEIAEILPQASDAEMKRVERKVRSVIEAFTGQYFGRYSGTLNIYGTGQLVLPTTKRILSIDTVSSNKGSWDSTALSLVNDGWGLSYLAQGWIEVNSIAEGDVYRSGPVISDPRSTYTFLKDQLYAVKGTFGYDYVPFDVKEAARALVNDYACMESLYRERYISDIRAADWRFAFGPGAFMGTGNIVADQILAGYQRNILAVI